MKANKAQEKIYLNDSMTTDTVGELYPEWFDAKVSDRSIEYTRTDAFIEKEINKVLIALDMDEIDCKNGKFFGIAINKVLDELIEENFWDFFKKKKADSVKLAAIKGLAQARVRQYILNN